MPRFAEPDRPRHPLRLVAGAGIATAIALLIVALFAAMALAGRGAPSAYPADLGAVLWISGLQAVLSTILSLLFGTLIAWALNRLVFPGKRLLVAALSAAIVLPGLVVAFGLIEVWGRAGWFGALHLDIFGLQGVIFAHVVLDAPFAALILLARLDAIPATRLKTGQSLGLGALTRFAVLDWPALRSTLPGLGAIIFLLAFTSFPIVLLLGGGPAVQTLELAIYAAVRLDFDLARAVLLGLVQMAICTLIILCNAVLTPVAPTLTTSSAYSWRDRGRLRVLQIALIAAAILLIGLPLAATLVSGLSGLPSIILQPNFWAALATSVGIAIASAALTVVVALPLALARAATSGALSRTLLAIPGYAYLAVPAVTLSLGAFLLVRNADWSPEAAGPAVVILANALLALPFALATLMPPLDSLALRRGRLIRSLGVTGWRQFRAIEWPLVAPDLGIVLALAFCFSLGDLGVIALFGTANFTTLPLLMLRAFGAYRSNDAAAIAAIMLVLIIAAFFTIPRVTRRLANA